ncbi:hypothetical protein BJY21_001459 [Kineosphaera limosa]|uniref:ABC transporter permease protein n=1 Tax=Kineosphaera limosa NBRC 100340 TaxID=1184609 RepID=K6WXT7_9MICO|nr:hypothetical protein [Kineosphaera limosa]NYE00275.1 hypothetical protein [Kineosphaera limosa]GAB96897.1 hypothetical protein KILIM_051_00400 [Kineosphaera limosa NBRC 100340]
MTATTPTRTTSGTTRWLRLAGWQVWGYVIILGCFLLAAAVIAAVVLTVVARSTTPTISALQFAQQAAPWFLFGVAIHYCTSWLGPHVVAGLPRRSFVKAAVVAAAGGAALGALGLVVLLFAERWIYGLLGWSAGADSGRVLATQAPLLPYLWGLFLLLFLAALTGLVVGLSYVRLGTVATFLLPLTLSPLLLGGLFAFDTATMFVPAVIRIEGLPVSWLTGPGSGVAGALVGLALVGAALVAIHLQARRIPIRSPRA